jgi:hypothetical protein
MSIPVFEWIHDGIDRLDTREGAIESATERAERTRANVTLRRLRPMTHDDIDIDDLVATAWNAVRDRIQEHELYCHDDGGPFVSDDSDLSAEHREILRVVLAGMCGEYVDLSDAAWTDTGDELTVTPSGEVLGQLALPEIP